MASSHTLKRAISLSFTRIPVQPFPVVAQDFSPRIPRRKRHTNAVSSLSASRFRSKQIMLVAKLHEVRPWSVTDSSPDYS